jgi:diguanylate cyclase (GGDEF)-like protein
MTLAHFTEVLFIGFFTAAGLYGALVFLITRDRLFLWYAGLLDTMAAAQLVFAPDLIHAIVPGIPLLLYRTLALSALFCAEAAFAWKFLQLSARSPAYARAVQALLALNLLGLSLAYLSGPQLIYRAIAHALFLALLIVCGAAAWKTAFSGQLDRRFYVGAFAGALTGAIGSGVTQSMSLGSWPEYFFQFGISWQGALLALALATRYTKIDPLTGAKSRAAFEEHLLAAWRLSQSRKSGMAVIMVAVGGLKEYEMRFGRIAGDTMLRNIANSCIGVCADRLDLFARYGDEAFAAIVRHVTRRQADDIALALREMVDRDCPLTVGVGVSSNENAISAEALAQQAARRSARDAITRYAQTRSQ